MTLPFGNPQFAQPPAPYARKQSIVDRVLSRLFPTAQYSGLLDPEQQQGLQRQGLLNVGLNLLQAGAPSANQRGTLANIGASIQGVNFPQMAEQALQLKAYRDQQQLAQAITAATSQPGAAGSSSYDQISAVMNRLIALGPEGAALAAKLAPVAQAFKPSERAGKAPIRIDKVRDNKIGSSTHGMIGTLLLDPDTQERVGFVPQVQTEKEPTPVERVAGSQLASATNSVATMEDIAQRNPAAAKAAVAAIKAGGWGKLGQLYSEARGFTNDPDAQNFYTEFNNALLSFSPIYGGTRTTQQILQLEKAAVLPALGSGDFTSAFSHLHNRLHDLEAKAGKAAPPHAAPRAPTGNPFPVRTQ